MSTLDKVLGTLLGVAFGARVLDNRRPVWARVAYAAVGYDILSTVWNPADGKLFDAATGAQQTGLPVGKAKTPLKFEEKRVKTIQERVSLVHVQAVKGTRQPEIYALAREVLSRKCGDTWCVDEKDHLGEIRAIFNEVKKRVRYTWDPTDYDAFQTPAKTLQLKTGDCDDYNSLLAAMLRSVGYKVRSRVVQTQGESTWNHIYLLVQVPTTQQWMPLDLSVKQPAGWEVPKNLIVRVQDFDVIEKGPAPTMKE